jgi:farnesyl-diphosphate farnesyltransferase
MARWALRGDDFPDEAALDAYMFEVAGRVGLLLTDLFTAHSPGVRARATSLQEAAVSFGLGLQTVNVIRGLHEDPNRGWIFIPRALLPGEGGIRDPRTLDPDAQAQILDFLVRKAGRHIADALTYCQSLPRWARGIRIFCIIPALLAARTAQQSHGNEAVFREPVKVSRSDVGGIVLRARFLFFSNGWLERERLYALALANGAPTSDLPQP